MVGADTRWPGRRRRHRASVRRSGSASPVCGRFAQGRRGSPPHRAVGELLLERRRADEVVFLAGGLPARLMDPERPEGGRAFRTRLAGESLLPKQLDLVFTLGHFRPPNERPRLKVLGGPSASESAFGVFRICTARLSTPGPLS